MIKIHYVDGKDFSFQTCECESFSVSKKCDGEYVLRLYDANNKFIKAVKTVDYFAGPVVNYEPDDYDGLDIESATVDEMRLQNGDY